MKTIINEPNGCVTFYHKKEDKGAFEGWGDFAAENN